MLFSSHTKQPLLTCAAGLERGGEGRKRERGLGREGKGLSLPFPFSLFSPSPVLCLPRNLTPLLKNRNTWNFTGKKNSCEKFLNSILYICEANYQTAQTPPGLPLNYSTCIIPSSVPVNCLASVFFIEQGGMINIIIITIGRSLNIFPAKVTTNKANTT